MYYVRNNYSFCMHYIGNNPINVEINRIWNILETFKRFFGD